MLLERIRNRSQPPVHPHTGVISLDTKDLDPSTVGKRPIWLVDGEYIQKLAHGKWIWEMRLPGITHG
jgi:hypothetical protein